ncbi:hypothetical protein ACJMK2_026224 [Sinanodonta woodiana]|uniref:Ig-like domain-containing protein n=1 Tax=Sinanodonta woodiana TaxID=1069815 RepID=A0ABD3XIZ1_SINWO
MGRMIILIICVSMDFIMGNAIGREDVVSIPGCNATLEWILASTYNEAFVKSIAVIDVNGRKVAEKKEMTCKNGPDPLMYCEVRNTSNKEWRFVVVLYNVTKASSGNYTGRIKYGPINERKSTIHLKVLDKPHIKEARTPILHEPLTIVCSVDEELEDPVYYWKLNGTYLNSTDRIRADYFTLIYERVTLVDKLTLFSCIVCSSINCCIESDTYVPDPYYGPNHVTLNLNLTDIYLRVNDTFKVMCSAKCNPLCTFRWDGFISSRNEELVINSFDSRMTGVYRCFATNPRTGVTVKSEPIFLHYVHDTCTDGSSVGNSGDIRFKEYWIGTLIVSVFLLIVGSLLYVKQWRKSLAREPDFNILNDTEMDRMQLWMSLTAQRKRLTKLLTTVNTENKTSNEDYYTCPQPQSLNNPRQGNAELNLREDMYRKLDQTASSFYDYAYPESEVKSHATESNNKDIDSDFVSSLAMCQVDKANVHVTDENCITPIKDPDCPIEPCENEVHEVIGSVHTYITPISDLACPIEMCHDTYITPISE